MQTGEESSAWATLTRAPALDSYRRLLYASQARQRKGIAYRRVTPLTQHGIASHSASS